MERNEVEEEISSQSGKSLYVNKNKPIIKGTHSLSIRTKLNSLK